MLTATVISGIMLGFFVGFIVGARLAARHLIDKLSQPTPHQQYSTSYEKPDPDVQTYGFDLRKAQ